MRAFRILVIVLLATCISSAGCAAGSGDVTGQGKATTISQSWEPYWVTVKYRGTSVDVGAPYFERLGRADSTLVNAAWYDDGNDYMVINLSGTNYHYCGFPRSAWTALRSAGSMGAYYRSNIKGRYDC